MRTLQVYAYTGSWIVNTNVSETITVIEEKTSEAGIIPIFFGLGILITVRKRRKC
ncbi:MAG: hypothetical protein ACFFDT_04845 [Candidatus Hodarchaeota archaeon]